MRAADGARQLAIGRQQRVLSCIAITYLLKIDR